MCIPYSFSFARLVSPCLTFRRLSFISKSNWSFSSLLQLAWFFSTTTRKQSSQLLNPLWSHIWIAACAVRQTVKLKYYHERYRVISVSQMCFVMWIKKLTGRSISYDISKTLVLSCFFREMIISELVLRSGAGQTRMTRLLRVKLSPTIITSGQTYESEGERVGQRVAYLKIHCRILFGFK